MSRIENIKGRFTRGYYNSDSDRDIEYLIAKIEIAYKALEEIENADVDHRSDAATLCRVADKALKQLRED